MDSKKKIFKDGVQNFFSGIDEIGTKFFFQDGVKNFIKDGVQKKFFFFFSESLEMFTYRFRITLE